MITEMSSSVILTFINNFIEHQADTESDRLCIRNTFARGYCYYFALMLQDAFQRGDICWLAPYSHIVWLDIDGTAYDIDGIVDREFMYCIPVSYIGEYLNDFKHNSVGFVPKCFYFSKAVGMEVIKRYEDTAGISETEIQKNWAYFFPNEERKD